jgi:cytochrome oxidase Cu insertion factor (SCO1/SenC/PrrC family)
MRARPIVVAAFAVLIATAPAPAQLGPKDGAGLIASELDRVKVGQPAPDFTLEDADGKAITLSDFRDKKSVVLVFYRGYW